MDDDFDLLRHARAGARELVTVARQGNTAGVFDVLRKLTGSSDIVGLDTRLIVGQLVCASAQMMLLRVGSQPQDVTYAVDLRDDDEFAVPIDELEPPLRATVRALLAQLNGRPDEADFQLDLALCEQTVPTTLDVVVHSLLWTIGLLEWCEAEQQSPPAWLATDISRN
ncbi:hypothetical protein [Kibdelosporangium phytohabitans]|uniref:Uncharacterized protein n=1 Tax=Kibdelosporangium phytohabitans TaxID=860235 RepID=A0A0N9HPV9_9PSEU|nr:hypothetical protein [Kibdelosporangium phytohabitans]ALG09091.1 hypothetical protein AOZ06_21155 [Kibdelosporangium phytohabitans]MBE1469712.1 hypothetical protein [Kibdelosporangium phytohabitans]